MQWRRPLLPLVSLALLPGCGATLRGGPKATSTRGDPALQGEATLALGASGDRAMMVVPLTVAAGSTFDDRSLVHVESGLEYAKIGKDSPLGWRFGGRYGGVVEGPGGFYVGARGGPMIVLDDYHSEKLVPFVAFEGIANVTTGGELAGTPTFGLALTIGVDYYSGPLRIPHGRPLRGARGEVVTAAVREGDACDHLQKLSCAERVRLGAEWTRDAQAEHASIASFVRVVTELVSLGAPPALVGGAHRAALDEARHAHICFAIASAFVGRTLTPDTLPTAPPRAPTLETLAIESLVDGCFGEALAASVLASRSRREPDPRIARALAGLARDEARHAELGWRILAWCFSRGGPALRAQVMEAWRAHVPDGDRTVKLAQAAVDRRLRGSVRSSAQTLSMKSGNVAAIHSGSSSGVS